jgi:hypothetical protein
MRVYVLVALLVYAVPSIAFSQSITLAWDPPDPSVWTIPEFRVYKSPDTVNIIHVVNTTGTSAPLAVAWGEQGFVAVSSYGWKLDEMLQPVWAEGVKSPWVAYQGPPPPPVETCAADGTGNGIDEDGDGEIDEGCLPPPPPPPADTVAPSVTVSVRQHGGSHNFTVTITASDNWAVAQIVLMQGSGPRASCSVTPPAPNATCMVELALKQRGTYTYNAQAWDTSNNMGAALVTIRR